MKLFSTLQLVIFLIVLVLFSANIFAKDTTIVYHPIQFLVTLKNTVLSRGSTVSAVPNIGAVINYHTRNDMFCVGLAGGSGFSGIYREFDYFAKLNYKGIKLELWDVYNFSVGLPWGDPPPYAAPANGAHENPFNYNPKTTGRFIDLVTSYTLPVQKFPLNLYWSTIVFGRDRQQDPIDTGNVRSGVNQYSSYVQLSYPVYQIKGYDFRLFLGGVFAFVEDDTGNFYTRNRGFSIVNIAFTVNKNFNIKNYSIPVGFMAMWNPANRIANLQVSIGLVNLQ